MKIQILERDQIDDDKWDYCIRQSFNSAFFAFSWYLDITCKNWMGIIVDDYLVVFPFPVTSTIVLRQIRLPHWIPYLGIFSQKPIDSTLTNKLLSFASANCIRITLNPYNKPDEYSKVKEYAVLDLIQPLEKLEQAFKTKVVPAMQAYKNKTITVIRSLDTGEYINYAKQYGHTSKQQLAQLTRIIAFTLRYKSAGLYAAYDANNQIIAQAFLIKNRNTLSLIHCSCSHKHINGIFAIIYHLLKHNSESNLTLEFPFHSKEIGSHFTSKTHICKVYKRCKLLKRK